MGAGRAMKSIIDRQKTTEDKAKYWDRRNESDKASELVGKGLGARAEFKGFDRDAFAREKRESARNRRATRRDERQAKREERQDYYRQQMNEKRRANEMRQPKEEMGGVGVLGARNPYGNDAVWDNERRSWAPNPKTETINKWNNYKNQSQVAGQGETNLFGQSRGVSFGPGSSARGTINEEGQGDNRDFKKLYEELLKIQNASKK